MENPEEPVPSELGFENNQLPLKGLPQIEALSFDALHKDYLSVKMLNLAIVFLVLGGGAVFVYFNSEWSLSAVIGAYVVLLVAMFSLEYLGFKKKKYAIRDLDISYKSGLIFQKLITIPFARIQHIEVTQGPISRMFDLAQLKIYTAGGSTTDLTIPGLTEELANQLRVYINQKVSEV